MNENGRMALLFQQPLPDSQNRHTVRIRNTFIECDDFSRPHEIGRSQTTPPAENRGQLSRLPPEPHIAPAHLPMQVQRSEASSCPSPTHSYPFAARMASSSSPGQHLSA